MLKRLLGILAVGLVIVAIGTVIILTSNLYTEKTVRNIAVNEASTDWYSTGPIVAQSGDRLEINVDSTGGSAKLRVDTQDGESVFPEVQSSHLEYEVLLPSTETYQVIIWTRAWPFPSNYVALQGSVSQKRVVLDLYPTGYVGIGVILVGLFTMLSGVAVYIYEQRKIKEEKNLRICPYCNKKTAIDNPICQFCGFNITRSIRCPYCQAFYDRSLEKCPNCGAKQTG